MNKKVASLTALTKIRKSLQKKKKKVVFTNGCFDILHVGHIAYLRKAKSFGDVLIVGMNSDSSVKRLNGKGRPIVNEKDRADVLSELMCVDYVVLFNDDTPYTLIKRLRPDVLVKGSDWKIDEIVGKDVLDSYGGVVRRARFVKGRSSTNVIKKIEKL